MTAAFDALMMVLTTAPMEWALRAGGLAAMSGVLTRAMREATACALRRAVK